MDANEERRLYAPILDRAWVHRQTDYNGNAGITTDEGMYVCSVPHEVAHRIVEDHNSALGKTSYSLLFDVPALCDEVERLERQLETAEAVAQMAAHDRDEALENFARVEQEYGYLVALLQRARVSLMGLMDAGTWSEPRGFRIDAEAALSEAHATMREIEEATDIDASE